MNTADPKPLIVAHPPDAIDTYRALRFGIVLVVGLIAVAQFAEWLATGDVSTSISTSFYTSVHGIFVGALFAAGTCLIIYRGNSDGEDSVLNFAGFMAFFVATIPTEHVKTCTPAALATEFIPPPGCQGITDTMSTGLFALVVLWVSAEVGYLVFVWRTAGLAAYFTRLRCTRLAVMVALVTYFCAPVGVNDLFGLPWAEQFAENRHNVAAVLMFLGFLVVVVLNARSARHQAANRAAHAYLAIAVLMGLTIAAVLGLHVWQERFHPIRHFRHDILVVEWILITLFAVFWVAQSIELWNVDNRDALPEARS